MRSVDDLTAAARIRDAAIERFGALGFSVGLRSIAEAAGVSAALVIHHFGSKDGLRKACDDYIAEEIRSSKSEAMNSSDPATWFAAMAEIEEYAPLMAYLVRSMQAGGERSGIKAFEINFAMWKKPHVASKNKMVSRRGLRLRVLKCSEASERDDTE